MGNKDNGVVYVERQKQKTKFSKKIIAISIISLLSFTGVCMYLFYLGVDPDALKVLIQCFFTFFGFEMYFLCRVTTTKVKKEMEEYKANTLTQMNNFVDESDDIE